MCVCPLESDCPPTVSPICGDDGKVYSNDCVMRSRSCNAGILVVKQYSGACGKSVVSCNIIISYTGTSFLLEKSPLVNSIETTISEDFVFSSKKNQSISENLFDNFPKFPKIFQRFKKKIERFLCFSLSIYQKGKHTATRKY